jgi:hypothetical protein
MENPGSHPEKPRAGQVERVVQRIEPIVMRVEGIIGRVRGLAGVYAAAAAVLWGVIFLPIYSDNLVYYGFIAVVLIGLLTPALILLLFYFGLKSVIALPGRLLEKAGLGETQTRTLWEHARLSNRQTPARRTGKLLGTLFEMRSLILDSKGMLLEYAALVRLANPLVLGLVGVAVVSGFFVLAGAVIGLLVVVC